MYAKVWSVLSVAIVVCLVSPLSAAVLENPSDGSVQSGIGILRGWKCTAGAITIRFDGTVELPVLYGDLRGDTQTVCGDSNNGFSQLINWNLLGDGMHLVEVFDNGVRFGSAMVKITTLGTDYLRDVAASCVVNNFPASGQATTLEWQEAAQNFVISKRETIPQTVLGLFSETATEKLQFDVDSFLGTFTGGGATLENFGQDTAEKKEGNASLRATVTVSLSPPGFAGLFISWGTGSQAGNNAVVRNMSAFAGGRLTFWVKTPINLEVGIRSGNVAAGAETSKVLLNAIDPAVADDTWRQICIPLSRFRGPAPLADLNQIKVFLVVASNGPSGGTNGRPATFRIDDARWESSPCP